MPLFILAVCISGLLSGCVPNRSYRRGYEVTPPQLPVSVLPPGLGASDCTKPANSCITAGRKLGLQPQRFYLSYVEFDDMGELWSIGNLNAGDSAPSNAKLSQLESAVSIIRQAKKQAQSEGTELVVIAFIHGWHNNASEYDEHEKNLAGFKTILQRLSYRRSAIDENKKPVVVGIFIAWRGQSLAGDFVASYWNRRDAATRVGSPSMTEAIMRLMFETKGTSPSPNPLDGCGQKTTETQDPQEEMDRKSHFLIIGHSFGARILEHSITQPMLAILLERQSQAESCVITWNKQHSESPLQTVSFQPPADLIVFLNPANSSLESKSMIEAFKRSSLCVTPGSMDNEPKSACGDLSPQGPLMISITSQGDWATGKVMPIAQILSTPGLSFRKYEKEDRDFEVRKQSHFFLHNDGNVPEMLSHMVQYEKDVKSESECWNDDWPHFTARTSGHLRCFTISSLAENNKAVADPECKNKDGCAPWNNTPFYVMKVPSTLIADHNDIFQDGTVELLNSIVIRYMGPTTSTIRAPAPSQSRPLSKSVQ